MCCPNHSSSAKMSRSVVWVPETCATVFGPTLAPMNTTCWALLLSPRDPMQSEVLQHDKGPTRPLAEGQPVLAASTFVVGTAVTITAGGAHFASAAEAACVVAAVALLISAMWWGMRRTGTFADTGALATRLT